MTREEILAMTADQLDGAMEELRGHENDADADFEALTALIDAVEERRGQLRSAEEARKAYAARIAGGEGITKETIDFKEGRSAMTYAIDTKEYRDAWLAAMQGKQVTAEERTALANGNYAIPQETLNKIYGKLELYPLLNAVDVMHIPGTAEIPVEGTINDAAVVAMGTAANDSADTLAHVSLGAYKLIKTVEITADVTAMSIPAFESWLVDRLANKIYRLATSLVATGSGTNTITGLTTISATGNTYTKTGMTFADLMKIIAALPSEYLPGAAFVMSRQVFFGQVLGLVTTAGERVVVLDPQAPAKYNIMGYPVILEDTLNTTGSVVFGDLKNGYVLNFGKDVEVARDDSVGFRTGSSVFRGLALADGKPTGVGLVRFVPAP